MTQERLECLHPSLNGCLPVWGNNSALCGRQTKGSSLTKMSSLTPLSNHLSSLDKTFLLLSWNVWPMTLQCRWRAEQCFSRMVVWFLSLSLSCQAWNKQDCDACQRSSSVFGNLVDGHHSQSGGWWLKTCFIIKKDLSATNYTMVIQSFHFVSRLQFWV